MEAGDEEAKILLIAGLSVGYDCDVASGPGQWRKFGTYPGRIAGQSGPVAYRVRCNFDSDGANAYLTGVEMRGVAGLPPEFARLRAPAQRYADFARREHVNRPPREVDPANSSTRMPA